MSSSLVLSYLCVSLFSAVYHFGLFSSSVIVRKRGVSKKSSLRQKARHRRSFFHRIRPQESFFPRHRV